MIQNRKRRLANIEAASNQVESLILTYWKKGGDKLYKRNADFRALYYLKNLAKKSP